jgi:hypothetical protein
MQWKIKVQVERWESAAEVNELSGKRDACFKAVSPRRPAKAQLWRLKFEKRYFT